MQTYNHSTEFHQLCQPIMDASPITFCSFVRYKKDGLYTGFMTDPKWTELYLAKHYRPTLSHWVQNRISMAKAGYDLWSLSSLYSMNKATNQLGEDCHLFNYQNGISIVDEYPDCYEITSFASPYIDGIDRFFIENHELLRKYILHIKEKVFNDPKLAGEFEKHCQLPEPITDHNQANKLIGTLPIEVQKIYLGYPFYQNCALTKRELNCLLPSLLGIPNKKIAAHLGLSTRTIEAYLNKLLKKTGVDNLTRLKTLSFTNKTILSLLGSTINEYEITSSVNKPRDSG